MVTDDTLNPISQKILVPPVGSLDSKIAIVGEAPGAQEETQREPWVGPAGQLLNQLISSAGILRSSCYLDNVIPERPPNNNISIFIKFGTKKVITTAAFDQYKEELRKRLEQNKANVIIAAGGVPLYALTGLTGITKRRGSLYESVLLPGRKVVPIIHPSAALRMYIYRHFILSDLRRALKESEFPEIHLPQHTLQIFPTFQETIAYLRSLPSNCDLAFDIEVTNEEVSHISFSTGSDHAISVAFRRNNKDLFTSREETEVWLEIAKVLANPNISKIGQNIIFDCWFLFRKYGIKVSGDIFDTMIGQAISFPDFPKGLDFLCSVYTREQYYKDEGKKHSAIFVSSNEEPFSIYSAKDSVVLHEIKDQISGDLTRQGNYEYAKNHMKLIEPLTYMSDKGIRIDKEGLEKAKVDASTELVKLTQRFEDECGYPINPNSTKQVMTHFYVVRKLKPYINRQSGNPTVDDSALKRIIRKGLKEAKTLQEIRKLSKMNSTYFNMSFDSDNRVRCSWNPVGTRYSRLSSSQTIFGTGANLQNQPHSMLKFFLADENYLIYNIDLEQADWRVVAYLTEDANMISALEKCVDPYNKTSSILFHKPTHEISDKDGSSSFGDGTHSERFWGKKANHAFNYGQGGSAFAYQMEIPDSEGKEIHTAYHSGYPNIRNVFWEGIKNQLSRNRTITNLFGRSYLFLDRWGEQLFNAAYSFIPQSTVADIVNQWGIIPIYNTFKEVELLMQVHDSLVFQIPVSIGFAAHQKILLAIKEHLEQPLEIRSRKFVIPTKCNVGLNLDPEEMVQIHWNKSVASQVGEAYERLNKRRMEETVGGKDSQ